MSGGQWWQSRTRLPPDILLPLVPIALPRGRMDVRLRVASYPNGSRALELRDADGRPFYSPTMAYCLTTAAELLPPSDLEALVVAIKPSAMKNGIAAALMEAGLLTDLEIEMPSDRHFVRLMRVEVERAEGAAAARVPPGELTPVGLKPLPVPPGWASSVKRIQVACKSAGLAIGEADAMLAWLVASRALPAQPAPLPPSGEDIVARLAPFLDQKPKGSPNPNQTTSSAVQLMRKVTE